MKGFRFAAVGNGEARFVAEIPQGRVLFDYGVAVTPEGCLLADVSPDFTGGHNAASVEALVLPSPVRLQGRVALLTTNAHQRYYHWMFDVLPRLQVLMTSGVAYERLIVNGVTAFQRESLDRLGIRHLAVEPSIDGQLVPDVLVLPSLAAPMHAMTLEACTFLRDTFLPSGPSPTADRLIYVSRGDALTRRVVNEPELIATLERFGFSVVSLAGLSVVDQAALFARARMVIGPHGAGFTNLVFAQRGRARLLELFSSGYHCGCFSHLCSVMGLAYDSLTFPSVSPAEDFAVDIDEVATRIAHMLQTS
jgi:capsular polysaccharide biosynthesis protein